MNSILEELCLGNISPSDRSFKRGSKFDRAACTLSRTADALLDSMDDAQKELYQAFVSAKDRVEHLEITDKFVYGFRLGLLLGLEVSGVSDEYLVGGQ